MTRRKSRISAFQIVFEMNINPIDAGEAYILADEVGEPKTDEFSRDLVKAVYDNKEKINGIISPHLKGWSIERISKISLAVLQISCAQLLFFNDISENIVINEAVEISKEFGGDDDYAFVNGILGSIVRDSDSSVKAEVDTMENS